MCTLIYNSGEKVDYRVLYDALADTGYQVEVYDGLGALLQRVEENHAQGVGRKELMGRARVRASQLAHGLKGTVFIGYEPLLLSRELLEGV